MLALSALPNLCRTGKIALIILSVALLSGACAGSRESERQRAARELFLRHCAQCHGADGEGRRIGEMRSQNLKSDRVLRLTDEALVEWIKRGGSEMPSFQRTLTEAQIRELVRFIREDIQQGQARQ